MGVQELHRLFGVVVVLEETGVERGGLPRHALGSALVLAQLLALGLGQGGEEVLFIEAVVEAVAVALIHEVHLADGAGGVAALAEEVSDRARAGGQRVLQDLRAVRVRIDAGDDGPARRHAHRRLAIDAVEAGAAAGDRVDVRGVHVLAAVAPAGLALVLVGHEEQQVEFAGLGSRDEGRGRGRLDEIATLHM